MNTFDILSGSDVKEQLEKLHEAVTAYIESIRDTVETSDVYSEYHNDKDKNKDNKHENNNNNNNSKDLVELDDDADPFGYREKHTQTTVKITSEKTGRNVDIDKILRDLSDIKSKLIDTLLSKKTSNYVLQSLNVVYNFDAFFNPIASIVVTYAIRQLYVNKIGMEIISNINNIIKCICMDMIARSKANRSLQEISQMMSDYHMKSSEIMSVTQKYIDARDEQVFSMLDLNIKNDKEGFEENIKSADDLIQQFSANDRWVATYGLTTKALTMQSANNLCLKIRKDMGSYITALSTCLDKRVVAGLSNSDYEFNREYDPDAIDHAQAEANSKFKEDMRKAQQAKNRSEELVNKGKEIDNRNRPDTFKQYLDMDDDDRLALNAYYKSLIKDGSYHEVRSRIPSCMRYLYNPVDLKTVINNCMDDGGLKISKDEKSMTLGAGFVEVYGRPEKTADAMYTLNYLNADTEISSSFLDAVRERYNTFFKNGQNKPGGKDKQIKNSDYITEAKDLIRVLERMLRNITEELRYDRKHN